MLHLGDHAPRLRRIRQFHDAADAIEAEPDQRLALGMMTANGAAGLFDLDDFVALAHIRPLGACDRLLVCGLLTLADVTSARLQRRYLDIPPPAAATRRLLALAPTQPPPHPIL